MDARAVPLLGIFENKMQIEVPLFQRQYVWKKEEHWIPLWEDISRKFGEFLEGHRDGPVHFLGAMVLDQKRTPATHVQRRQVIDGQQRLTTLQIFLAAFRDFCRSKDCEDLAKECEAFTFNRGMMADAKVDCYKVWPTQLDRPQFVDVISSLSRRELERRHPLTRRKYARKDDPRPRMVEAYCFFYDQISEFFVGSNAEPPLQAEQALGLRLEECFQSLKSALQVVEIDLEDADDAQVIFETLNARGEPLLPADLLRNFIFLRAGRLGEDQEELYDQYWRGFDDHFWREEVRQGRLSRPRSDLFMQHFLSGRRGRDIPIKHLYVEYRHWIEREHPFSSVQEELSTLARQKDDFRRIIAPTKGDPIFGLARFLDAFDSSTAYPLILVALGAGFTDDEILEMSQILESYLLRRAVCNLTTKNYNRIFLQAARLVGPNPTPAAIRRYLMSLTGDSARWPDDTEFHNEWTGASLYPILNNAKVVYLLRKLSEALHESKSEPVSVDGPLTVEHLMPQNWIEHWPLRDGSSGLDWKAMLDAAPGDPRAAATRARNSFVHVIGNLTILTQSLNSAVSNGPWEAKRSAIMRHALLPINRALYDAEQWDEQSIISRSESLYATGLRLWPRT